MQKISKRLNNYNSGFTLLETIVAILIFSISILSLLVTLSSSISNTNYAKRKLTASYLAQEGIEYMRNLRDTYVLYDSGGTQSGWNAFNTKVAGPCATANGCSFNADALDYNDGSQPMIDITLTACSAATCPEGALSFNSANGKYGFSGTPSGYNRKITITQISANETKVFSTIFWTQGSGTYSMTLSESVYNWVE